MLTRDLLMDRYEYRNGKLYYIIKCGTRGKIGDAVGSVDKDNSTGLSYITTKINGVKYRVHRLIWIINYGEINDTKVIDHIDGNGLNNNIDNLRLTTSLENNRNAKRNKNNKSGHNGVTWYKNRSMWRVSIGNNGKQKTVGYYQNLDDAIVARKEKESEYEYHKNHNR